MLPILVIGSIIVGSWIADYVADVEARQRMARVRAIRACRGR